jgi:hypothetical protein
MSPCRPQGERTHYANVSPKAIHDALGGILRGGFRIIEASIWLLARFFGLLCLAAFGLYRPLSAAVAR